MMLISAYLWRVLKSVFFAIRTCCCEYCCCVTEEWSLYFRNGEISVSILKARWTTGIWEHYCGWMQIRKYLMPIQWSVRHWFTVIIISKVTLSFLFIVHHFYLKACCKITLPGRVAKVFFIGYRGVVISLVYNRRGCGLFCGSAADPVSCCWNCPQSWRLQLSSESVIL